MSAISSLPRSPRNALKWIASIAFAVLLLDWLTKIWAVFRLKPFYSMEIVPGYFRLAYGENPGIAFGLFRDHGGILHFIAPIAFVILLVIIYKQFAETELDGWYLAIFGLLIGGALGNILNRLYCGYVVDFIDFYNLWGYHWPTFNVADSALSIGEVILVGKLIFWEKRQEADKPDSLSQES